MPTDDGPRRLREPGPPGLHQLGGLGRQRIRAEQERGAGEVAAQREHLPGMRVGRARLGVQVVAVIPDHHEAKVVHRREGRGPRSDDHAHLPARDGQPSAVPLGRAEVGGQRDELVFADNLSERGGDQVGVAGVGDNDDRSASPRERRLRRHRDRERPGSRTGEPRQHRPDQARGITARQRGEVRRTVPVLRPRARCRRRNLRVCKASCRGGLLHGRMPRRDGEPQHIRERAGIPVGDRPGEREHVRTQDRLG